MSIIESFETNSLPPLDAPRIRDIGWTAGSDYYRAYASVLSAESHVLELLSKASTLTQGLTPAAKDAEGKLVAIRVAGHFLLELDAQSTQFGATPSATLVKWFLSPPGSSQDNAHDVIINSGTLLRDVFIRAFRKSIQYTSPLLYSESPPPSFDTLEDMIKDAMESTGHDYISSRKKALARDGYRCTVTGVYHSPSYVTCTEIKNLSGVAACYLEVAHIFDEVGMQGVDLGTERNRLNERACNNTYHTAGAMAILKLFGFSRLVDAFTESKCVYQTWNLLSMQFDMRCYFDRLNLWFEHTEKSNCYKVCVARECYQTMVLALSGRHHHQIDDASPLLVEFNSYEQAPSPDSLLLDLHAMCARVAHMSGAAKFFDEVELDAEETTVLAADGSSGSLLGHLLSPYAAIPGVS